jgi:hypothetical protein
LHEDADFVHAVHQLAKVGLSEGELFG